MKVRKLRTRTQVRIKINKGWDWAFDRLVRKVCEAHQRFDKHLQDAMGAAQGLITYRFGPNP
jgi:hypothetical protein